MTLDTNNRSVFKLRYCLVLVVDRGLGIINEEVSEYLKDIFNRISLKYNITLEEWKYESNNIQLLFKGVPNIDISKFLNAYKSASSRLVKNNMVLEKELIGSSFWSKSYCLFTINSLENKHIEEYIKTQIKK